MSDQRQSFTLDDLKTILALQSRYCGARALDDASLFQRIQECLARFLRDRQGDDLKNAGWLAALPGMREAEYAASLPLPPLIEHQPNGRWQYTDLMLVDARPDHGDLWNAFRGGGAGLAAKDADRFADVPFTRHNHSHCPWNVEPPSREGAYWMHTTGTRSPLNTFRLFTDVKEAIRSEGWHDGLPLTLHEGLSMLVHARWLQMDLYGLVLGGSVAGDTIDDFAFLHKDEKGKLRIDRFGPHRNKPHLFPLRLHL